ncbi:hypothetical protein XELAEV_18016516mg [Xenopus laevis]|uniref:Uncharacterized protein n=1 Tax=Xenopus laevis TaxID=8355 RepID=A0A974DMP1_XENLA|nr:hypothetical protein XELAEV_18016516mg [Xenopus laevis]
MAAAQSVYELKELRGFKRSVGNFVDDKFLSVGDIDGCLKHNEHHLSEERKKMISYITRTIPDGFLQLGITFPITNLQHVTTQHSMIQIMKSEFFSAETSIDLPWRHPSARLLYWSVQVPPDEIKKGRQKAFQKVQSKVESDNAKANEEDFNLQFANSPAFNADASRYGNFKFSFSLSDLLSAYNKLSPGYKQEFKVLGTAMYKQEIAHIVLVHSSDTTQFNDLPSVSETNAKPFPFVFQEDGKLYWRPESTAANLKMRITANQCHIRECPVSCYYFRTQGTCDHYRDTYTVWNHLVFAFHLPDKKNLRIHREKLKEGLRACGILEPYLREKETKLTQQEAEDIIWSLE